QEGEGPAFGCLRRSIRLQHERHGKVRSRHRRERHLSTASAVWSQIVLDPLEVRPGLERLHERPVKWPGNHSMPLDRRRGSSAATNEVIELAARDVERW